MSKQSSGNEHVVSEWKMVLVMTLIAMPFISINAILNYEELPPLPQPPAAETRQSVDSKSECPVSRTGDDYPCPWHGLGTPEAARVGGAGGEARGAAGTAGPAHK